MAEFNTNIYYVEKPYFREAMMTLAFKKNIDWLEEGMSLLSWKYRKVANTVEIDHNKIYKKFKGWAGNGKSRTAGHNTISIGDIVETGDNARLITGSGWVVIPDCIWKKIIKN